MSPKPERAFGSDPECLGILIVRDLPPSYAAYRRRLLTLAYKFAKLDENIREQYTDASSSYSFGWSHGKEIMNGKPDLLKGSYYANPLIDRPSVSSQQRKEWPEYYAQNIWPKPDEKGVEGFEEAFKDLGKRWLFTSSSMPAIRALSVFGCFDVTAEVDQHLANYEAEDEPVDSWCGFHLDHSLLTGLCSAMYLSSGDDDFSEPIEVQSPSKSSGLYIRTRGGKLTKVSVPEDSLAFQTGEALEIATGGKLRATPHCVRVGSGVADPSKISRETFALFMQPDTNQLLSPSVTFGQFSRGVFNEHYERISD
ncbi:Clavaminate synthase-like protein [Desarmillaria tabescens]|uniref:Clavaminate synthase-like protein n=1 Tax=Armillaria tabescens TaxID=1929756 RepID=A0AA39U1J9_ARMTA|nr:Clavaminate synthase-like protein [Desarmillaria tabescens]KAK0465225.1 Clavaminate synthase-like protein [Desarmillaria tabescens]